MNGKETAPSQEWSGSTAELCRVLVLPQCTALAAMLGAGPDVAITDHQRVQVWDLPRYLCVAVHCLPVGFRKGLPKLRLVQKDSGRDAGWDL